MTVSKVSARGMKDDLRPEYDSAKLKGAVRGKYYRRLLKEGSNIVVLDPDVAEAFRDSVAVNDVLRSLLKVARSTRHQTAHLGRPVRKRTVA